MKKKIINFLLAIVMLVPCLFMFTACGGDDDKGPALSGIAVEYVGTGYTMTEGTITTTYGAKVALSVSDFKVTAVFDDQTTAALALKTETTDGFTFASTVPADEKTPAGEYKLTFAYGTFSSEVKIVVQKATVDMSGVSWDYTEPFKYDGTEHEVVLKSDTIPEGVTVTYQDNKATYTGENYQAKANFVYVDSANYNPIESMTLNYQIKKGDFDLSSVYFDNFEYDGLIKQATIKGLPQNVAYEFVTAGSTTSAIEAGEYTVVVKFTYNGEDKAHYNEIPNQTYKWKINRAYFSPKQKGTLTYNGSEQTAVFEALPSGITATAITGNTATNAGGYMATFSLSYTEAAKINYVERKTVTVYWTIGKAQYNMSGVSWNYTTPFTYDGTEKTVELVGLPSGVTANYVNNEATNAGSYTAAVIEFEYDTTNYFMPSITNCEWVIEKANYNLSGATWDYVSNSFTYDGTEKSVSLTNLPTGVTVAEYAENSATNAGSYTASVVSFDYDETNYNAPVYTGECSWSIAKATIDETKISWNVQTTDSNTDGVLEAFDYYNGFNHTLLLLNETGVEIVFEWVDGRDPENMTILEIGEYSFVANLYLSGDDQNNYNDLTKTSYSIVYEVKDFITKISLSTLEKDDAEAQTDELSFTTTAANATYQDTFVLGVQVSYAVADTYTTKYFKDQMLVQEITDFSDIAIFENSVWIVTYNGQMEPFDVRKLTVDLSFTVKPSDSDTTTTIKVGGESVSFLTEAATFGLTLPNVYQTNISSKLALYDAAQQTYAEALDTITLAEVNDAKYVISIVYNDVTYSYQKNISIVQSASTEGLLTATISDGNEGTNTCSNNVLETTYNVSNINEINPQEIAITPAAGYAEQSREIVSVNGNHYLKVTLEDTSSSAAFRAAGDIKVCYILLGVSGKVDSNTSFSFYMYGCVTPFFGNSINITENISLSFVTDNEYAKIHVYNLVTGDPVLTVVGRFETSAVYENFVWGAYNYRIEIEATDGTKTSLIVTVSSIAGPDGPSMPDETDTTVFFGAFDFFYNQFEITSTEKDGEEVVVLEDWSSSYGFVAYSSYITLDFYKVNQDTTKTLLLEDKSQINYHFQETGTYLIVATALDGVTTRNITVEVKSLAPLFSIEYGTDDVVTLTQTVDNRNLPVGDFIYYVNMMEMDFTNAYFEGYLGTFETIPNSIKLNKIVTPYVDSVYTDATDKTSLLASLENVELQVKLGADGYHYVEFFIIGQTSEYDNNGTPNDPSDDRYNTYDVAMNITLYLCARETRVTYPAKITIGADGNTTDYNVRGDMTRVYDHGDVGFDNSNGCGFISATREQLGMTADATTASITITLQKAFDDFSYVIVSQAGYKAVLAGTYTKLSDLIANGLAFKATESAKSFEVPITFNQGYATVWCVTEGYAYDMFMNNTCMPLMIQIEGEYNSEIAHLPEGFEASVTIAGKTVSTENGDFVAIDQYEEFFAHIDAKLEDVLVEPEQSANYVVATSISVSLDAILKDSTGNAIGTTNAQLVIVNYGDFGLIAEIRVVIEELEEDFRLFIVFEDSDNFRNQPQE